MSAAAMTTVAGVIIGDEILSGKVHDENAPLIVELCRDTCASLRRLVYVGDGVREIGDEVARTAAAHDVVITSGGLGPTHDDCTVRGVAAAFALPVVRSPELETLIRTLWGDHFSEAALRMADVPEGARLVHEGHGLLPMLVCRNVFLLPGVPRLFATMLPWIRRELSGPELVMSSLYLNSNESQVALELENVDRAHPEVKIGSYPRLWEGDHRLWITFEGVDRDEVRRAARALLDILPEGAVVRTEGL